MRCWQRLCALSCTAAPAIPRAVNIHTGNSFVAKWLGVLRWRGNVGPRREGSICGNVELLFVLSKARAVRFIRFVQWNPVIMSPARFRLFRLKIQSLFRPELCYIGKTTYKKKSTGFQKFQKFRLDKPESDRNRWGSVKYSCQGGLSSHSMLYY